MAGVFGTLAGISVSTSHIRFLFLWSIGTEKIKGCKLLKLISHGSAAYNKSTLEGRRKVILVIGVGYMNVT